MARLKLRAAPSSNLPVQKSKVRCPLTGVNLWAGDDDSPISKNDPSGLASSSVDVPSPPIRPDMVEPPRGGNDDIGIGSRDSGHFDAQDPWGSAHDFQSAYLDNNYWSGSRLASLTWEEKKTKENCVTFVPHAKFQTWFHKLTTNNPNDQVLQELVTRFNDQARKHENEVLQKLEGIHQRTSKEFCDLTAKQKIEVEHDLTRTYENDFQNGLKNLTVTDSDLESLLQQILAQAGIDPPPRFPAR